MSGAGLLKMFNKATDAVSKMTIKMNESDIVSSPVPLSFPYLLRLMGQKLWGVLKFLRLETLF